MPNDFNSSIATDSRMYAQDIQGSIAHVTMLSARGIIPMEDGAVIATALAEIKASGVIGEDPVKLRVL